MKLTIYNAISIDGFIAKEGRDSDWVSEVDVPYFEKAIKNAGCIIMGRKTFKQYEGELYPFEGVRNIVITRNPEEIGKYPNVMATQNSPKQIRDMLENLGHKAAIIAGGGETNASFLQARVVDEIILSVHPIIIGKGIKLFELEDSIFGVELEKISVKELTEGLIQITYRVKY